MIFRPHSDGYEVRIPPEICAWLAEIPPMLEGLKPGDPAFTRLRLPVYPGDPQADEEWWRWMGSELSTERNADREVFRRVVAQASEGIQVTTEELEAMLRVLVEARLALAARLGIEDEEDYQRLRNEEAVVLQALAELELLILRALG
ncbi:MAG: hypothetical protein KatS3mg011_0311 [Acidimicrobiia bacterium]|nr:MAG: hypothetical protein KatS3mg011_0311 [Acidimicrobiia bacterium]